uniref:Uncharacterized protein n=1 Tax=Anguilla anguilla TaxID=7936 RepID=A0A0E9VVH1_ANGAN
MLCNTGFSLPRKTCLS